MNRWLETSLICSGILYVSIALKLSNFGWFHPLWMWRVNSIWNLASWWMMIFGVQQNVHWKSTYVHVMAGCLMAPSHSVNKCSSKFYDVLWCHSMNQCWTKFYNAMWCYRAPSPYVNQCCFSFYDVQWVNMLCFSCRHRNFIESHQQTRRHGRHRR